MTIYKKLFRDLLDNKGANIATIVVIAIAVLLFNGSAIVMDDLIYSKEQFYQQCIFPDGYVNLMAAPINFEKSYQKITGISLLEGRMSEQVKLLDSNKTLRFLSKTKYLAKYVIMEGREPISGAYEILIGNNFAKANGLGIGDSLEVVANGKLSRVNICGIARSAENIFEMKDAETLFSDPSEFGIAFVDLQVMREICSRNYFDEILFSLDKNVKVEDVKDAIDQQFRNYGIIRIYPRKDQFSDLTIEGEIKELKTTMIFMPIIFLIVAALVMVIMIKRMISQQRGQIGILKAFGYSDFAVGMHYASYCIVLGIIGGILGAFCGVFLSTYFIDMYKNIFNMKFLHAQASTFYIIKGVSLAVVFCAITGVRASVKAMKVQPAAAMRPEAPISAKKSILERLPFFDYVFNSRGKMAVRNIVRNRLRSFFIIIGLSLAFAISVMPWSLLYMMDDMLIDRYKNIELYDAKISLKSLQEQSSALQEIRAFPGVNYSQAQLNLPVQLKNKGIIEDIQIIGLAKDNQLFRIVDSKNKQIEMKESGIVLSQRLANKLSLTVGDDLGFKSSYAKYPNDEIQLKVSGIVAQGIGMNGYMDIDYLSRVLGYRDVCNLLLISCDHEEVLQEIEKKYQDSARVKAVYSKQEVIDQTKERMSSSYSTMYGMAFIAMLMSFAIVYNIFLVVILERKREFSTLMVLGMGEKEVLSIIELEQWISFVAAIFLGIPIAKLMVVFISKSLSSDMFTMPQNLEMNAIFIGGMLMTLSIVFARFFAEKKIRQIDLVESLKAAE